MTGASSPPETAYQAGAIKVVVCDDHDSVRYSYATLLSNRSDIDVVGEASDGAQAEALAVSHDPHVVLMDVSMPNVDGIEATRRIKKRCPSVEIVILTAHTTDENIRAALDAGACGYIEKGNTYHDIVAAIGEVAAGGSPMSSRVARKVLDKVHPTATSHGLTDEEIRCVRALADYDHNQEIAVALNYSSQTVKGHLRSACAKLGVNSRNRVLAKALQRGIIDLP